MRGGPGNACGNRRRAARLLLAIASCAAFATAGTGWAAEDSSPASSTIDAEARGTYGPIGPDDTLWSIAARVRPGRATIEQTMTALVRLNPDAFVDGDRNRIRGGAVLGLPTEAEVLGGRATPGAVPEPGEGRAEASTEGERLVAEDATLRRERDQARGELVRAADENAALRRTVRALEGEVDGLKQRLAERPSSGQAPGVPLMVVVGGALVVAVLAGLLGMRVGRRRVGSLAETEDPRETEGTAPKQDAPPEPEHPVADAGPGVPEEESEADAPEELESPPEDPPDEPPPPEASDEELEPEAYSPNTKLNLARAYANMGDAETAREVLEEVLAEGDAAEQAAARELLDTLE